MARASHSRRKETDVTKQRLEIVAEGLAEVDEHLGFLQDGSGGNVAKEIGGVRDVLHHVIQLVAKAVRDA